MRTREEQIEEIMDKLSEGHPVDIRADMAANIISEAEQRVRAEIGRDSERMDWLEKTRSVVLEDADNGWRVTIGGIEFSLQEETARNAIDAAMETK